MKRIFFFATPSDIRPVLHRFASAAPLKFVEAGVLSTPYRKTYLKFSEIPAPGIATHETGIASKRYMVSYRDTKDQVRVYVIDNGERRWALDNGANPEAVDLVVAGLWNTGTLLPGNMSTLHRTLSAQQLMKTFLSALKKEKFSKVREFWLGKEAMEMLKAGKRLAMTAEQSPPEFDLKLPI